MSVVSVMVLAHVSSAEAATPPEGSIAASLDVGVGRGGPIALVRDGARLVAVSPGGTRTVVVSTAPADWSTVDPWGHVVWSHARQANGTEALFVTDLWAPVSSASVGEGLSQGLPAHVKGDAASWWAVGRYVDFGNFWLSYGGAKTVTQRQGAYCNTAVRLDGPVPSAAAVWGSMGCEASGETEAQQTARARTMTLDTTVLGLLRARALATPEPGLPPAPAVHCTRINDGVDCNGDGWNGFPGTVRPLGRTGYETVMVDYVEGDLGVYETYKFRRSADEQWLSPQAPATPVTLEAAAPLGGACVSSDGAAAAVWNEEGAVTIVTRSESWTPAPSARFVGWLDGLCR